MGFPNKRLSGTSFNFLIWKNESNQTHVSGQTLSIFDPKYTPSNYNKAGGTPLCLFDSPTLKIDVSKRSKEDMGFWHRNIDFPLLGFKPPSSDGD